jgi:hypothetical protein
VKLPNRECNSLPGSDAIFFRKHFFVIADVNFRRNSPFDLQLRAPHSL